MLARRVCLSCALIVVACLSCLVLPAERAGAVSGVTIVESPLPNAGSGPYGITNGPDGNLWFTEFTGNRIGRVTPGGQLEEWPVPTAGSNPLFIEASTTGSLWFTEYGGSKIGKITTGGDIVEYPTPTPNSHPSGIALGSSGSMWFTEQSGNRIGFITPAGTITEYSLPHAASGAFDIVSGPDGCRWFTEYDGDRIGRIVSDGSITEYPLASGRGPWGITLGPDGALWFTEYLGERIGRITTTGEVHEWDLPHLDSGPTKITAGPDGALWFLEDTGNRLGRITTNGEITEWNLANSGSAPMGIVTGPGSALYFTEYTGNRLARVEVQGNNWYLAEGCTAGDFETWVLVQNPNPSPVCVGLTLMTESGPQGPADLQGVWLPAHSRTSFNLGAYVQSWDVSTMVAPNGGDVICERAVYGGGRAWGADSIGTTSPSAVWNLAEGCTAGDFETWVLVQNPGASPLTVDLDFMTSAGLQAGPQDVEIGAYSRKSFDVAEYVTDYDVSTRVTATGGIVVCERAVYGNGRQWAHDSIGFPGTRNMWFLPEGCTAGDFETWVLVQNPNASAVTVDLTLMTESGPQNPPALQDVTIPARSRRSFDLGDYVQSYNVSTRVDASGGGVVCERAVYGGGRTWGTDSIGSDGPAGLWYLAEGCTEGGMETWVLVQNAKAVPVTVDLTFMTSAGPVEGPQDVTVPAESRISFNLGDYVTDWDVSTQVYSENGGIVCERAMYGNGRQWAHDSIGYAP